MCFYGFGGDVIVVERVSVVVWLIWCCIKLWINWLVVDGWVIVIVFGEEDDVS